MKVLTTSLLLALALTACNRDNTEQPAQTGAVDTATAPADATAAGGTESMGTESMGTDATAGTTAPPMTTGNTGCEGLTGQAQTDCINRTTNATSTMGDAGAMGDSGMTGDATTPPAGTTGDTTGTSATSGDQGTGTTTPPQP